MYELYGIAQRPAWVFSLCPAPPDWTLDWQAIEERFTWAQAMAGVAQEPSYHAEGDVLIHTRMVAEALIGLDAWRGLAEGERSLLFLAALLHDVAKPECTRVEADGRIASPGHARVGALMARSLLWQGEGFAVPPPFLCREIVARLVRFHGLPLWFFDKPDPTRAVIAASQSVRLEEVALLAEADVRGRICADQDALLERIDLFRMFCEENECYTAPRAFASAHSRFRYFHSERGDPAYDAYDDTRCEVVLLTGLPGAGKDTWIREHRADWPVISLDAIRKELHIRPEGPQGKVVQTAKERARYLLRQRQSFVWNATNITYTLRSQLIDLFAAYSARVRIVYLDAPRETLLRRNAARTERVPERIVEKLARKLETPDLTEAHAVEWIAEF